MSTNAGIRARPGRQRSTVRTCSLLGVLTIMLMLFSMLNPSLNRVLAQEDGTPAASQDSTPDASAAQDQTPARESGALQSPQGTDPGSPAVLAQGLAFLAGDDVVWQVRDFKVPGVDDAVSESGNAAIILQREGNTVIRNDVTGKRTLIGPGQAFFRAPEDAYTISADGGSASAWIFEVLPADDVADDIFYESPTIDTYDEGTYDMELTRYVLPPSQDTDILDHNGPALVMATAGEVQIEDDGGVGVLGEGDGQVTPANARITNSSTGLVEFVVASFGETVDDSSAGAGTGTQPETASPETPAAEEATDSAGSADSADTADGTEATVVPEDPVDNTGEFVTTINITAEVDIYVQVTADGVVVFDSTIPAGGQSGAISGSVFEVYTSSGVNTTFTDACGNSFLMGYEEGEANYYLAADENSCAP